MMLKLDKINASFDDALINEIVDTSIKDKIGARGLRSCIEKDMMNLMFEISKYTNIKDITITRKLLNEPSTELQNHLRFNSRKKHAKECNC